MTLTKGSEMKTEIEKRQTVDVSNKVVAESVLFQRGIIST